MTQPPNASQWAKEYFFEHPSASTYDATVAAEEAGVVISRAELGEILSQVTKAIAMHVARGPVRRRPDGTSTKIVPPVTQVVLDSVTPPASTGDVMDQAAAQKKFKELKGSDDPKVKWAAEQAEKNPAETTLSLNRRISEKFGKGFTMPALGEITRLAREAQGIKTKPTRPRKKKEAVAVAADGPAPRNGSGRGRPKRMSPVDSEIKNLVRAARAAGLFGSLKIAQDGSYEFDLKQAVMSNFSGRGTA